MITVKVGARSYELNEDGTPIIGQGKYPEGDSRRLGPQYVHYQRTTRIREERRARMTEHARKAGFKSFGAMLVAQKLIANQRAPKDPGRTKALKRDNPMCARKAQRNGKAKRRHNQELAKGMLRRAYGSALQIGRFL